MSYSCIHTNLGTQLPTTTELGYMKLDETIANNRIIPFHHNTRIGILYITFYVITASKIISG